jgi:hypothetical protein
MDIGTGGQDESNWNRNSADLLQRPLLGFDQEFSIFGLRRHSINMTVLRGNASEPSLTETALCFCTF